MYFYIFIYGVLYHQRDSPNFYIDISHLLLFMGIFQKAKYSNGKNLCLAIIADYS